MSASECTTTAAATATPAAPSTPTVSAPGAAAVAHDSPWRTPLELTLLGAIWGGSFLFMRVAASDFGPFPLVEARLGLGALVLLPLLWAARAQFTPALWLRIAGIAAINSVIPFALFAWGAERAPAGIGAITNAMTVMFTALVAFLFFGERIGPRRLIGLVGGFVGVANLVSGTVMLAPLAIYNWPHHPIGAASWASALLLGVLCTGVAFVFYYRLIARVGAPRTSTVTYLIPLFGVIWAWLILGEPLTLTMALAGALILAGVALSQSRA